jgi:hypothetical protein
VELLHAVDADREPPPIDAIGQIGQQLSGSLLLPVPVGRRAAVQPCVLLFSHASSDPDGMRGRRPRGSGGGSDIDDGRLVGMISQADIARSLPDSKVGELIGAISEVPPNN